MIQFKLKRLAQLTTVVLSAAVVTSAMASSHREAPYISKYPQSDGTDFYAFRSYEPGREDTVTFLANYIPVQAAYGGPNYFPLDENAIYEIHIDTNGDAQEDLTFEFDFENAIPQAGVTQFNIGGVEQSAVLRNVGTISADQAPNQPDTLNYQETYEVTLIESTRRSSSSRARLNRRVAQKVGGSNVFEKPFDYSGTKTFGGVGEYGRYADQFVHEISVPGCDAPGRVFVGQRLEGFKVALGEVFDLVNFVPIELDSAPGANDDGGLFGAQGAGVRQDPQRNVLERNNVTTIALEMPISCVTQQEEPVIGAWTTSSLRQVTILDREPELDSAERGAGRFQQVSRLGHPLVNELFVGFEDKDSFNGSVPSDDGQFASYVTNPVFPAIINALFLEPVNQLLGGLGAGPLADLAPTNFPRTDLVTTFLTGFPGVNQPANVVASEVLRLNTAIDPTARADQSNFGLVAGDLAGFPNGRRPGDDIVDISLRVAMGALCHPVAIDLNADGIAADNLGLCSPDQAPIGNVALTDGVPLSANNFEQSFPYLLVPYPGSPTNAPIPTPRDLP